MAQEKNFKIKIGLNAMLEEKDTPDPDPKMNLRQAVQAWWDSKDGGKQNLLNYLNNTVKNVQYKSFLHTFSASDTVDKETYE